MPIGCLKTIDCMGRLAVVRGRVAALAGATLLQVRQVHWGPVSVALRAASMKLKPFTMRGKAGNFPVFPLVSSRIT